MRLGVRTTLWLAGLALLGGCSTAPLCDVMDRACPTRSNEKRKQPYGGVCVQGRNSPYLQPAGPVAPPTVIVGPPVPMQPPPGPVIPPPTPSPFLPQPVPGAIPAPPPPPPGMRP